MMTGSRSRKNTGRNRKNKKVSVFHSRRIEFAARKVVAITVSEQSLPRAIIRPSPNRRLHCPNFPSMALRAELSASCCFRNSGFTMSAGRPRRVPESLMPCSAQYRRFALLRNGLSARTASASDGEYCIGSTEERKAANRSEEKDFCRKSDKFY